MVEEYQVDGVVDVILQACHTYAVESLAIKRHVRQQHNIPYIAIETDYSTSGCRAAQYPCRGLY